MATKFKPFWELIEERAYQRGFERGFERGLAKGEILYGLELKRPLIERLIKKSQLENTQIAYVTDAPIDFVESIRLKLEQIKE
jgi:hypothetical protein